MTRIFQSGFESGTAITEWPAGGNVANLSFVTSPVHCGAYAARFTGAGYLIGTLVTPVDAAILRWYHRIDSASIGAASRLGGFMNAGGHVATLRLRTDRQLELIQDGPPYGMVSMALSGFQLPINEWFCLELLVDVPNLLVVSRYNGTGWATRSALVNFAAAGLIIQCYLGPDEATTTGCNQYYDDVAVNSLAGERNCFWPGMVPGIRNYPPTADGEVAGWGAGTRYTEVDEAIPDDDVTYVRNDGVALPSAPLGLYFDLDRDWPISALFIGCRAAWIPPGSGGTLRFDWHDPQDLPLTGGNITLANVWTTHYAVLNFDQAFDGSRRVLNTGYLRRAASRLIMLRVGGTGQIMISTVWLVVEHAMSVAAPPLPHPYPPQPQILVELQP